MTQPTYDDDLANPQPCVCGRWVVHGPCKTQGQPCPMAGLPRAQHIEECPERPCSCPKGWPKVEE